MSIFFSPSANQFILNTKKTTYAFDISKDRYLRHLYYGKKVNESHSPEDNDCYSFAPYLAAYGDHWSTDIFSQECSFFGSGDFRADALRLRGSDGTGVTEFIYDSYRIFEGRHSLDGLPEARADETTQTLEISLVDPITECRLYLYYTVFEKEDVISRYMVIENRGEKSVKIEKCMSLMLDLERSDLDMVSLYGSHPHECNYQRVPLHHGTQSISSRRGGTSHQYNPFFALCSRKATEEKGDVYGFNFVYSGCFLNEVEVDQQNHTRVLVGLGSECFSYTIDSGERFCSPEAVMTYSNAGFGCMSRNFHSFIRSHILPPEALKPHPIVLNTWEACLFNIQEETLLQFADEATKIGFDMLVMDDGWFGKRNHDRAGLGDWFVNLEKFPKGLKPFVEEIKAKGIQFGIWVEPEMINPDSDLYRAHPEWCLNVPGREPKLSRNQLVLDMSNPEVIAYLKECFSKTFKDVPIDYFKWDMNRHLSDVGSSYWPADRQDEVRFRYTKGVYSLLQWFREQYPDAVIETCSGGGGRYDLGMMCYGIQIWTSDNTNPYDRTMIQSSALIAYPATTMSCHVSNPKDSIKSLDYRYKVALGGMLGYELHILRMSDEIKTEMKKQILQYRELERLMRLGAYYNLASPVDYPYSAYYYASETGDEFVLTMIEKADCKIGKTKLLKIRQAKSDAIYQDQLTGTKYTGECLRHGISFPLFGERDHAEIVYLKKI